jgi:DNA-binding transcriptional regulator GbsR (MarR family)
MLRGCAEEVEHEKETDPLTKERIREMLKFVESTSNWYEEISDIPTSTLTKLMGLGKKITKLVRK